MVAGADEQRVEHRSPPAGFGMTDEEPVLLADGTGTDVVLGVVVVDLDPAVLEVGAHRGPLAEGIVQRFAKTAFRSDGGRLEMTEGPFKQPDERPAPVVADPGTNFGTGTVVPKRGLDPVEQGDDLEDPPDHFGTLVLGSFELAPDVGEAGGAPDLGVLPVI